METAATIAPPATALDSVLSRLTDRAAAVAPRGLPAEAGIRMEFVPPAPKSLQEAKLTESDVEQLAIKFIRARGQASGREIAEQLKLPFPIVIEFLRRLKQENLVAYRACTLNDYICELTVPGLDRAKRCNERSSYYGAAPVAFRDYIAGVDAQSLLKQRPSAADFRTALSDLILDGPLIDTLGQGVCAGRAMMLFGSPGNGKTSIAERVCSTFGKTIWIPRCMQVDGVIVRVYDPTVHQEVPMPPAASQVYDHRWVRIARPTIVCGGELVMSNLEFTNIDSQGILEAPMQLKSNCGTLVIDDFGRQRVSTRELLNRWIVPLERRYDFLNSPCGKKLQVPFDQIVMFSTNLQPHELADDAFLRRIPYKVNIPDPDEASFRELFRRVAKKMSLALSAETLDYVIAKHYAPKQRPFRCCHPRDLLTQVADYCLYLGHPPVVTQASIDRAVSSYFAS